MEDSRQENAVALVAQLVQLKQSNDRGALAKLKRYVLADDFIPACSVLEPMLGNNWKEHERKCLYLMAGLFAYHPENCSTGNIGNTMWNIACAKPGTIEKKTRSTEKRLIRVLGADREEIYNALFSLVSQAKSANVPINYAQLLCDLIFWGDKTKRQWAVAFYHSQPTNEPEVNDNVI